MNCDLQTASYAVSNFQMAPCLCFFSSLVISGNQSPFSFLLYEKYKTKFVNKYYTGENKSVCCPGVALCKE